MSSEVVLIQSLKVQNVRCVRSLDLDLDYLTVIVGRNDTGKSTILECLRDISDLFAEIRSQSSQNRQRGDWLLKYSHYARGADSALDIRFSDNYSCQFEASGPKNDVNRPVSSFLRSVTFPNGSRHPANKLDPGSSKLFSHRLSRWRDPYRLDPRELRNPSTIGELDSAPLDFNGRGLADVLDRMPHKRYGELLNQFTRRIPHVEEVLREAYQDANGQFQKGSKGIYFQLKDGNKIPASQVSDGAMLVLGYLAIFMDVDPQPLILIEEPENGIHPGELKDLLDLIKDMTFNQKRVQVVMTTHSPYLLEYVPKECVRVITRSDAEGTKAQRFDEIPSVKKMLSVGYSNGDAFFELNKEGADKV